MNKHVFSLAAAAALALSQTACAEFSLKSLQDAVSPSKSGDSASSADLGGQQDALVRKYSAA